jgi:mannose-6-phosphate isomerase-like protein (cupin superfamily)
LEIILGQIEYGGQADCHIHENSEQAFFVLEGKALLQIEGEEELISPNDLIYLPKGTSHKVVPVEGQPLKLLIVYAPPLSPDEPDG